MSVVDDTDELLRSAFEITHLGICFIDTTARFVHVNQAFCTLLGYQIDEVLGKAWTLAAPPDVATDRGRFLGALLKNSPRVPREWSLRHKDGRLIPVLVSFRAFDRASGMRCVAITFTDIEERKRAEQEVLATKLALEQLNTQLEGRIAARTAELAASEAKHRNVLNNVSEGIAVVVAGHVVFMNARLTEMTGYALDTHPAMVFFDYVHPDDLAPVVERVTKRMRGDTVAHYMQFRLQRKDGSWLWVESSAVLSDWEGHPATVAFLSDLTERRANEDALRASEEKYRYLVENVSEGITVMLDGRIVFANARALELIGSPIDVMQVEPFIKFVHEEDRAVAVERYQRRMRGEPVEKYWQFRIQRKDGMVVPVEASVVSSIWNGQPAVLAFLSDLSGRQQAEEALRRSEERYRAVVDNISEGLAVVQDGRFAFLNQAALDITGYAWEEVKGKEFVPLVHPDDRGKVIDHHLRRLRGEPVEARYDFRMLRKDGSDAWVELAGVAMQWDGKPATLSFVSDITDRKRLEDSLKETLREREAILENTLVGITHTVDGHHEWVNRRFAEMVGFTQDELIGMATTEHFVNDTYWQALWDKARPELEAGRPFIGECMMQRRDGTTFWVQIYGSLIDPADMSRGRLWTILDISERVRLDASLKQTLAERDSILDNSIAGMAFLDGAGKVKWTNAAMSQMFGSTFDTRNDITLEPYFSSREDYHRTRTGLTSELAAGHAFDAEVQMRRLDGTQFWIRLSGQAVDPHDAAKGAVLVITDVTNRRLLEAELMRSYTEREAILQSTLVGITFSVDRRHQWINRKFAEMMGWERDELLGQSSLVHFPDEAAWEALGREAYARLATGQPYVSECQMKRKDGTLFWVQLFGSAVDPADLLKGTIWTFLDVTERHQALENTQRALTKERELNELKSRFVSMTSHEFRTPLASILSSAELLRGYADKLSGTDREELMANMVTAVHRMTRMLDDVLTIGRADAGRLEFNPAPVVLSGLCDDVIADTTKLEQREGRPVGRVRLEVFDGKQCLLLDEKLLRHILGNLLSNALKYSPPTEPVLFRIEADVVGLRFAITDRGIGIPADDLPHLFESFFRARNVGNTPGTGLGLAIVKKSVELHGGTITVDSRSGVGTTFTVTIPAASAP